jgi:hypothetical protein
MTQLDLRQRLMDLHAKLLATQPADPAMRDQLQQLTDHIRPIIETGPTLPVAEAYQGLRDRLAEAAVSFEVSHPQLSKSFETLIDTLGQHNL